MTGQRREDLVNLGPRNVRDGRLWVVQGKTKTKIAIPLELRLKAVGWSVGEVIARCRDAVPSGHFIHHSRPSGRAKPGDRVQGLSLALSFATARDQAGLAWSKGATPPSLHEMRSLAARLYAGQGTDAQSLLGHKSPEMTALYRDSRGRNGWRSRRERGEKSSNGFRRRFERLRLIN
ncbi:tyrosine-type recombinase/integrase [Azospirillum doebereinerae]